MGFAVSPFMLQSLLSNLPKDASPTGIGAQALKTLTMKPDGSVALGFNTPAPQPPSAVTGAAPKSVDVTSDFQKAIGRAAEYNKGALAWLPDELRGLATSPVQQAASGGFFSRIGNALSAAADYAGSPTGQNFLGQLAQAIGGDSVGGRLGQVVQAQGQSDLYRDYLNKLLAGQQANPNVGQPVLSAELSGLSPELLQRGIETWMAQREQSINDLYKRALIANLGQQETPEERFQREMALQLVGVRPSEPKAPQTIRTSVDPSGKRLPERQYYEYAFNPKTGKYDDPVGLYVEPSPAGGDSGSNPPAAVSGSVYSLLAQEFYDSAIQNVNAKDPDSAETRRILAGLKEPVSGAIIPERVFSALTPQQRLEWAKAMAQYQSNYRRGVDLGETFMRRLAGPEIGIGQYSAPIGPTQPRAERARAYLKSIGKEGNDAQVNLFLKNNPQF